MFAFVCPLIVVSFGLIYGLLFLASLPRIAFTKRILPRILPPHQNSVMENVSLNLAEMKIKTDLAVYSHQELFSEIRLI